MHRALNYKRPSLGFICTIAQIITLLILANPVSASTYSECTDDIFKFVEAASTQGVIELLEKETSSQKIKGVVRPCYADLPNAYFNTSGITQAIFEGSFQPPLTMLLNAYNSYDANSPVGINPLKDERWNFHFGGLNKSQAIDIAKSLGEDWQNQATIAAIQGKFSIVSYLHLSGNDEPIDEKYRNIRWLGTTAQNKKDNIAYKTAGDPVNGWNNVRALYDDYIYLGHKSGAIVRNLLIDGPGHRAGLDIDDIVLAVNGVEIKDRETLLKELFSRLKEDVHLTVERQGSYKTIFIPTQSTPDFFVRHAKFEHWLFNDEPFTVGCSIKIEQDSASNMVLTYPAGTNFHPEIPGLETLEKILLQAMTAVTPSIIQSMARQKFCPKDKKLHFYIPIGLLGDHQSRTEIGMNLLSPWTIAKNSAHSDIDIFVHNNATDGNTSTQIFTDFKGDEQDFSLNNLTLFSQKNADSLLQEKLVIPEQIAPPPQPDSQYNHDQSVKKTPDVNLFLAAIISFSNAATFEFGDELYCKLFEDKINDCRNKARILIQALDAHYPWTVTIFAILGYIMFAPTALLYVTLIRGRAIKGASDAFSIFFKAELFEGALSIIGQTLTYQDGGIFFFAILITVAVALVVGGVMAWKHDAGFRYAIKVNLTVISILALGIVILSNQAQASAAGGVSEIFNQAAKQTDNTLSKGFNDVATQTVRHADEQAAVLKHQAIETENARIFEQKQNDILRQQEEQSRILAEREARQKTALEEQRQLDLKRQQDNALRQKELDDQKTAELKNQQDAQLAQKKLDDQKHADDIKRQNEIDAQEKRRIEEEHFARKKQDDDAFQKKKDADRQWQEQKQLDNESYAKKAREDQLVFEQKLDRYYDNGITKGAKDNKHFSDEKQALVDMAKKDKKMGMTADDMQAYKDLNKELPDPFPSNKVRGPEIHPNRPHGKEPHGHVGPVDHIPIKDK